MICLSCVRRLLCFPVRFRSFFRCVCFRTVFRKMFPTRSCFSESMALFTLRKTECGRDFGVRTRRTNQTRMGSESIGGIRISSFLHGDQSTTMPTISTLNPHSYSIQSFPISITTPRVLRGTSMIGNCCIHSKCCHTVLYLKYPYEFNGNPL